MSVVVTGAAGFIGRHVVAALGVRGYRVVGVDRRAWRPAAHEDVVVADLVDGRSDVTDALRQADGVIHLAGRPGVRGGGPDLARDRWHDNVLAGQAVLDAVPAATPLVVASSSSVYGGTHGRASRETDPLRPAGDYARTKVELERRCRARRLAGGSIAIARPFTVAGEGQRPDMALATWIAAARQGRPLTVLGSPGRSRDVTDVRDVAEGFVRLLEREVTGVVNLGTGRGHRLADLVAVVAAQLGVPTELRTVPAAAEEPASTLADTCRCAERLGFVPSTDLPSLVARQIVVDTIPDRSAPLVEAV